MLTQALDEGNINTPLNALSSVSPENQCFSLLSSIAQRVETTNTMKILLNVEIAAMHISLMWKVSISAEFLALSLRLDICTSVGTT